MTADSPTKLGDDEFTTVGIQQNQKCRHSLFETSNTMRMKLTKMSMKQTMNTKTKPRKAQI